MNDCIFCRIVRGEIPSYKVYEDNDFIAFFDISQFTPGHTLVIPKKHYEFVWDVVEIDNYIKVAQKIAQHYRALGYKYVDSLSFGRAVQHAHIHLVPQNDESSDYSEALSGLDALVADPKRRPTVEEGNKLVEKFKL
jgi:histidine triad (HIT) family protein